MKNSCDSFKSVRAVDGKLKPQLIPLVLLFSMHAKATYFLSLKMFDNHII